MQSLSGAQFLNIDSLLLLFGFTAAGAVVNPTAPAAVNPNINNKDTRASQFISTQFFVVSLDG